MDPLVCKVVVLENKEQRVLKPKQVDEKNNLGRFVKASSIKKCLFGVASPGDTEKMLQEQYEADRQRFNERFGFDIQEIENLENENVRTGRRPVGEKCVVERRVLKGKRRMFKPYNRQAVMTDPTDKTKRPSATHNSDSRPNSGASVNGAGAGTKSTNFYQATKNVQSQKKFSKEEKEN